MHYNIICLAAQESDCSGKRSSNRGCSPALLQRLPPLQEIAVGRLGPPYPCPVHDEVDEMGRYHDDRQRYAERHENGGMVGENGGQLLQQAARQGADDQEVEDILRKGDPSEKEEGVL